VSIYPRAQMSCTELSCVELQADGTLEESASPEDAELPHPSKRRRTGCDPAKPGTAGAAPAAEAVEPRVGSGQHQTRHRAHAEVSTQGRATVPLTSHQPAATAVAPPVPGAAVSPSSRHTSRGASRLGTGHATARSASVGERRSIQLLLSAVVEELHRHESEPAGGARLTLDDHPTDGADATVVSAPAEEGSGAVISAGQAEETAPDAEPHRSRDAGAAAGHTAGAAPAEAHSTGEDGSPAMLPPGSTAPAGGRQLRSEAPQLADPGPSEEVTESAPSPALPRRGPQPPVSPFAALQSSGSLPDKDAAEPCANKASPVSCHAWRHPTPRLRKVVRFRPCLFYGTALGLAMRVMQQTLHLAVGDFSTGFYPRPLLCCTGQREHQCGGPGSGCAGLRGHDAGGDHRRGGTAARACR